MAEEFQAAGICSSSSNWWSTSTGSSSSASRNGGLGTGGASSPCSTALTDINNMGTFGWGTTTSTTDQNMANRSCDESAASISSVSNFQDSNHKVQDSVGGAANSSSTCVLMDSTLQMAGFGLASPTIDWTHALLRSSGRAESNFQAMLQEDLTSRGQSYRQQDPQMESGHVQKPDWSPKTLSTASDDSINNITFKHINQAFAFDQQRVPSSSSGDCSTTPTCQGLPAASGNFYGCSSTMLQGLFDPEPQQSTPNYDNRSMNFPPSSLQMSYRAMNANENIPAPWPKFPQFLKSSTSPPKQHSANQLHFSNNTPYWNAAAAAINDVRAPAGFYSSSPAHNAQFLAQSNFEEKPNCSSLTTKTISSEGVRDSCSATTKKSTSAGSEPSFKRPRIETPSPLPTFKVRKEKLGDRITALQQLVSPFGKTDTASVLHEAIEYIKFLHDQVTVLSTPYMKNGASMQHQQNSDKSKEGEAASKQDLRSRGLCLVPISSTFPVTNETTADFWTPTFGGTYR